jgi:PKHD-type hydroxylase
MGFEIIPLLTPEEVHAIVSGLAGCVFADGRMTAKGVPRSTKDNLQVDRDTTDTMELDRIVFVALQRNPAFQSFTLSKRVLAPIFSKYEPGMHYGSHVDNALMGGLSGDGKMRTDFSMTVFLSPPGSYDGGELVVEMEMGSEEIKLSPGEAVVYSAATVHHVAPVTRGVRLAAVTWIQSVVRDERIREILQDLAKAAQRAEALKDSQLQLRLSKSYNNLLRYAAEP